MKTVTEKRRSSARATFIALAESADLVLNSLWDWKPVERLKQGSNVVSFTFFQDETSSTGLNALKVVDIESRKTRKERITVVKV